MLLSGNYLAEKNNAFTDFNVIDRPSNLMKALKEISGKSEGSIPDLLLIAHNFQKIDPSIDIPQIPYEIMILLIEAVESSLQGFPEKKHATEALRRILTWKELYNQEFYKSFNYKMTEIFVKFYIVRGETIGEYTQISR